MDGTFYTCPSEFTQLFIIHGKQNETYVPLVYLLLPSKTIKTYCVALRKVVALLPATYSPKTVLVDFEESIHAAVREIWQSVRIGGCRFHLGQAWHRKIQALGLARTYRSKSAAGSFLRTFFGLPFLKPEAVEDFYLEDLMAHEPKDKRIREFCDYVYDTYVSSTAKFPPSLWAQYSAHGIRTTNACEGLHARLREMFYHAHPHFFY